MQDLSALAVAPLVAPAWVLTLGTVAFMSVKAALWLRGQNKGDEPGSRERRDADIEWRTKMLSLAERQEGLMERVHSQSIVMTGVVDRLVSLSTDTAKTLREHDTWERQQRANRP